MDSIRSLVDRLLKTWQGDAGLTAGQLYVINSLAPLDVEVSTVGDHQALPEAELQALLERAADPNERPGFEVQTGSQRAYIYPLKDDGRLQGIWLVIPTGSNVDWARWTRDSTRFSQELFALREAGPDVPPTFRQLAEAFPDEPDNTTAQVTPALHWEHSQSRVDIDLEADLSQALLVDWLPIF